jgi:hypothetical protein
LLPIRIFSCLRLMNGPVDLDDETGASAIEVHDEGTDGLPAPDADAAGPTTEYLAERHFGRRWILTKLLS